jgi:CDP-diacylglycerol--serine O-phosphatidyltransferase
MAEAVRTEKPRNLFGIKDLFTTANVLSGLAALILCVEGQPFWAGVAILLGWVADAFDGAVARALGTANRFGGEYDTIADHLAHIIAPALIVFTVYKQADLGLGARGSWWVGAFLAAAIVVTGSVRHARNIVRPVSYKGIWCGLPRTVVGFLAISYANSKLLPQLPGGWWAGAVICLASCWLTLTYLPYTSHHLRRKLGTWTRIFVTVCIVSTFGLLIFRRAYVFDLFLFWMVGYSLFAWNSLTAEERAEWRKLVDAAKARGEVAG